MLSERLLYFIGHEDDVPVEDTEGWIEDSTNEDGDWDEWKDRD
jgi:hypothetical protein